MAGSKTIELRRVRPKVVPGSWALIYASSPEMRLLGAVELGEIVEGNPQTIWPKVRRDAGVTKAIYDGYYTGATTAYGIRIKQAVPLRLPIDLATLRTDSPSFRPPQSYAYLKSDNPAHLPLTLQLSRLVKSAA